MQALKSEIQSKEIFAFICFKNALKREQVSYYVLACLVEAAICRSCLRAKISKFTHLH